LTHQIEKEKKALDTLDGCFNLGIPIQSLEYNLAKTARKLLSMKEEFPESYRVELVESTILGNSFLYLKLEMVNELVLKFPSCGIEFSVNDKITENSEILVIHKDCEYATLRYPTFRR
jgi:hypothetical protein